MSLPSDPTKPLKLILAQEKKKKKKERKNRVPTTQVAKPAKKELTRATGTNVSLLSYLGISLRDWPQLLVCPVSHVEILGVRVMEGFWGLVGLLEKKFERGRKKKGKGAGEQGG